MDTRSVLESRRYKQRVQHTDGVRVATQEQPKTSVCRGQGGAEDEGRSLDRLTKRQEAKIIEQVVEVITVCESWWPTRAKTGVHVLNPSPYQLRHAKRVAWLAGTNTVYLYRKLKETDTLCRIALMLGNS